MHHAPVERLYDWAASEVRIAAAAVTPAARGLAEDDALRDAIVVVGVPFFPLQVDPVEGPDVEGGVLGHNSIDI